MNTGTCGAKHPGTEWGVLAFGFVFIGSIEGPLLATWFGEVIANCMDRNSFYLILLCQTVILSLKKSNSVRG